MKKGHLYTAGFMIVLSAVLTFALALAYESFKPMIAGHKELAEKRAVLYALGLDAGLSGDQVLTQYDQLIKPGENSELGVLTQAEDGVTQAYAVPFEGAGLWGTIRGYLGVSAELDQIKGVVFTAQNETPGLGGRIDEEVYKQQFRGIPIDEETYLKYGSSEGYELDAVTGATQTSKAVLRMLNQLLDETIYSGEVR